MEPWQRTNEQTSKMGWPGKQLPLLGVRKSVVWVTIRRHEMCDRVGVRRPPQTVNEQKQKEKKKNGWYKRKERNARFILRIQLNDNQIRLIWEMV